MIELPEILAKTPSLLLPVVDKFNDYRCFLLHGGRGGGKSWFVAAFLLFLADIRKTDILCLREMQNSIDESVKKLLEDLIKTYNLDYHVTKTELINRRTGSKFVFKGMKAQNAVSIKSIEGMDIVWFEEAQTASNDTLKILLPTIRKSNSKFFFTMNRFLRSDPAFMRVKPRKDCLTIKINYTDNPNAKIELITEAEECLRLQGQAEFNHVWLGNPLEKADDYLFNTAKLDRIKDLEFSSDGTQHQSVMGIDVSGAGGDLNVATLIERSTSTQYEVSAIETWSKADTMQTVGHIVALIGKYKPDVVMIDADGLGKPMFDRLVEVGIKNIFAFHGGGKASKQTYLNARAEAYYSLSDYVDRELIAIYDNDTINELEYIKYVRQSNGIVKIEEKKQIKKELGHSPDRADALMMAFYGVLFYMGKTNRTDYGRSSHIKRVNKSKRYK